MNTPESSPRKPRVKRETGSSNPAEYRFLRASTPPPSSRQPVEHPVTPPDTPQKKQAKFDPNQPLFLQEALRIEQNTHIAKPLFGTSVSAAERILHHFDMQIEYGPSVGLPRIARWERATELGLEPPKIVGLILKTAPRDSELQNPYSHGRI